jgi:hypothetical protein
MGSVPEEPTPASPLTMVSTHGKELLALVAAVATAMFGTAHAMFYGSLDVGIHDVGLGPVEVLSQAAIGIVAVCMLVAFLAGLSALLYRGSRGSECRLIEAVFAGVFSVLVVLVGSVGLAIVIVWSPPVAPFGAGVLAVVLVLLPLWLGRLSKQEPMHEGDWRRVAAFVGAVFAIALVYLAGVTAAQDAGLVRRGIPPEGFAHSLAGGPAPCVTVTWIGLTLPSNVPARAIHLGEAGGRVVLYVPGQGPVRLPASTVVISPAGEFACRRR